MKSDFNSSLEKNSQEVNQMDEVLTSIANMDSEISTLKIVDAPLGNYTIDMISSKVNCFKDDILKFTITVQNTGNTNLSDLQLTNVLDNHFTFVDNSLVIDGVKNNDNLNNPIVIGNVNIGGTKVVTFNVTATSTGYAANLVDGSASFINATGEKETLLKKSTKLIFNIIDKTTGDFEVIKTCNKTVAFENEELEYTVSIKNTAFVTLNNVILNDQLDSGLTLVQGSISINGTTSSENDLSNVMVGGIAGSNESIVTFRVIGSVMKSKIPNSVMISANYTDPDGGTQTIRKTSNIVLVDVISREDVAVLYTKSVDKTTCKVNDILNFTVNLKNIGNMTLNHVSVRDNLDPFFEYIDGSTKINGVTTGNFMEVTELGDLTANQTYKIEYQVRAKTIATRIPNSAILAGHYERDGKAKILDAQTNEVFVHVLGEPAFGASLTKNSNKLSYYLNEEVLFTIILKNTGTVELSNIVITDDLNNELTFKPGSIKVNGTAVSDDITTGLAINNLGIEEEKTISFSALPKTTKTGIITKASAKVQYSLNSTSMETTISSNDVSIDITKAFLQSLTIDQSAGRVNLYENDMTTVALLLVNTGTIKLQNIKVFNIIPNGLEFVLGSVVIDNVKTSDNIVSGITIKDLNPLDSVTIGYTVLGKRELRNIKNTAFAQYDYTNLAGVKVTNQANSNVVTFHISKIKMANLTLEKHTSKAIYALNDIVHFSIDVRNTGNVSTNNISFRDDLPDNYEILPNTIMVNGKSVTGNIKTGISIDNILANQESLVEFSANAVKAGTDVYNTAYATYSYENESGSMITQTSSSNRWKNEIGQMEEAIIKIDKDCTNPEVFLGEDAEFILKVTNIGNKSADVVKITDVLNSKYTLKDNSITVDGVNVSGDIEVGLDIGPMAANQTKTIKFMAIAGALGNDISNQASSSYEYFNKDNIKIVASSVSNYIYTSINEKKEATLITKKTALYDTIFLNEKNTFTLEVQNIGNIAANNVVVIDILDPHYTIISNSLVIDGVASSNQIEGGINLDTILPNQKKRISFDTLGQTIGTNIKNTAITNYEYDPNNGEIISETISSIPILTSIIEKKVANVSITLSHLLETVKLNEENTFVIELLNDTDVDAKEIVILDRLPNEYAFIENSLTIDGLANAQNITKGIKLEKILAHQTKTLRFKVRALAYKSNVLNEAQVSFSYTDVLANKITHTNYSNKDYTNITEGLKAILTITKIETLNRLLNDTDDVVLTVTNVGNTNAQNIILTDILPGEYEYIDDTLTIDGVKSSYSPNNISIVSINPNSKVDIVFSTFAKKVGTTIKNIVDATYEYTNENSKLVKMTAQSNASITNVYEETVADVVIIKEAHPTIVSVTNEVMFYLTIRNNGNKEAVNISVKDYLPIEFILKTGSIKIGDSVIASDLIRGININKLLPKEELVIEFIAIPLASGDNIKNEASVAYSYQNNLDQIIKKQSMSNPVYLTVKDKDSVIINVDQKVSKTNLYLEEINAFSFNFRNDGNVVLNDIKLDNYLIDNYTIIPNTIQIIDNNGMISQNEVVASISVGTINPGEEKTVKFDAMATISGANIINFANVSYSYTDSLGDINYRGVMSNSTTTNILEKDIALISLEKSADKMAGLKETLDFTIKMTNIGSVDAEAITITDFLDDAFELVANSLIIDNVPSDLNILYGIEFEKLKINESHILTYQVKAKSVKNAALNKVKLEYHYTDLNNVFIQKEVWAETTTDIVDSIIPKMDLILDANRNEVMVGETLQARIIGINKGFKVTYDVSINSPIPTEYSFVPGTLKRDGKKIEGDLTEGIYIGPLLQDDYVILTFDLKGRTVADNIIEYAHINYTYLDEQGREITESLKSYPLVTSVTPFLVPLLEIHKDFSKKVLVLNDINHFDIYLFNDAPISFTNLKLTDIIDERYEIITNSITIDNISVQGNIEDLVLPNISSGMIMAIGFDVKAVRTGLNIKNESFVAYQYQDLNEQTHYQTATSKAVYTSIVDTITPELIRFLMVIATEEFSVYNIIISEINKLKTILAKSKDPSMIIRINDSITKMIITLSLFETISRNKLSLILKKIYTNE